MTGTPLGSPVRHTHHASPVHEPPAAIRATGIIVAITVALAILAIAFALAAARPKPHRPRPFPPPPPPRRGGLARPDPQSRCLRRHFARPRRPQPSDRHRWQP